MNTQLPNNLPGIQEWYQQVADACDFFDTNKAFLSLHQWDEMIGQLSEQQRSEVLRFKEKLLFIAFPELPLSQAAEVMEKKLLNIVKEGININEILKKRFLYLGYGNQEADRVAFRNAVLKNQQLVGGKKVSEWLQAFDKAYPPDKIREAAAGKFFTGYPGVVALSKKDQAVLKLLLQVYDEWLREPITMIYDTTVVYQKLLELEKSGVKEVNAANFGDKYLRATPQGSRVSGTSTARSQMKMQAGETLSLPLLSALSKYHQLAQQPITREKIRLRTQVEPVRPTLMNWLKYYRSELGIGYHDSVQRGEFLYRSENGRRISDEERERLGLILKSIEEDFPVPIDTARSEIVFPEVRKPVRPSGSGLPFRPPAVSSQSPAFLPREPRREQAREPVKEQRRAAPVEMPVAKPLSFHEGGVPRSYRAEEREEWTGENRETPLVSKAPQSASQFAFKDLPPIRGLKPAPAFSASPRIQRGKPAFAELRRDKLASSEIPGGKSAWKAEEPQTVPTNMSFTSPHVFPAERESKENWQRERERITPPSPPSYSQRTTEKNFSSPQAAPPVPPLAPRRNPDLPRPKMSPPPNRFNITPMSYREKSEEESN